MRSGVRVACFYMHARRVGTENLDVKEHQNRAAMLLYESLLTCVVHLDLVGDPLQDTCHAHASKIHLLRFVRYST